MLCLIGQPKERQCTDHNKTEHNNGQDYSGVNMSGGKEARLAELSRQLGFAYDTMQRYKDDNSKSGRKKYYTAQSNYATLSLEVKELLNKQHWSNHE